jgi:MTH538 TIR-like domain (DUF1863)
MRNCFICYHHDRDQDYLEELRANGADGIFDYSLKNDISDLMNETIYKKIRQKMYRCSVTIVLIGNRTGHRKWIDWELWASLRPYKHPTDLTKNFIPNGLVGVYLPGYSHSVPDRLQDNIDSEYAVMIDWEDIDRDLENAVKKAYQNRMFFSKRIDNSRQQMTKNYLF